VYREVVLAVELVSLVAGNFASVVKIQAVSGFQEWPPVWKPSPTVITFWFASGSWERTFRPYGLS